METTPTTPTDQPPAGSALPPMAPRQLPPEPRVEIELRELGERIATLSALLSATEYQLLVLIREFDERYGWRGGFRSCAHWLNWRTGLSMGAAREKVRVALALADLPRVSAAMERGELSFSKVRALSRIATPDNEDDLLNLARSGTAAQLERVVRAWRRAESADDRQAEAERHDGRYLHFSTAADGSVVVRGRLDPETGAALMKAVEAAEQVLFDDECEGTTANGPRRPSAAQRRADAVGHVAEAALAGGLDNGTRGDRYQVVVHVDATTRDRSGPPPQEGGPATTTIDGVGGVSAETSRRIACDASRLVMTHDETGRILDVGRKTRAVSPALRRALEHRDGGCRFPGCGNAICDAHHVEHWADGGETRLDNLVLLCRRHHRFVHEEGYEVSLSTDGAVTITDPWGREIPSAPGLPALPERPTSPDAAIALLSELMDDLDLDPRTGLPEWDGRPLDLDWALNVLMN